MGLIKVSGVSPKTAPGFKFDLTPQQFFAARSRASTPTMSRSDFLRVTETAIEDKIFGLLASRQEGATLCPSEVARALVSDDGPWRKLMLQVRQVAQGLAVKHRLNVTRGGVHVDATSRGGPIRLGRPTKRDDT